MSKIKLDPYERWYCGRCTLTEEAGPEAIVVEHDCVKALGKKVKRLMEWARMED